MLSCRQCRSYHHTSVNTDNLASAWRGHRIGDDGERDVPASGSVKGDAVGLALWHRPRSPKPHPANLGYPDLAPAAIQPPYMKPESKIGYAKPFVQVTLAATGIAVGTGIEVSHCLAEVTQSLLLQMVNPGREPRIFSPCLREHPPLLDVARNWPYRPPFLMDPFVSVPVETPGCFPVGLKGAELVQVPSQVPHVPGMRAVIPQDSFLLKRGVKPIPGHMTTVVATTDIPGKTRL